MKYISRFKLVGADAEQDFFAAQKMTCYQSFYPYHVFPEKGLETIEFSPVTILCGGNGSGKTTLLNVMAEKLALKRTSPFNRSAFFSEYVGRCSMALESAVPSESAIITSDDVFDYLLDLRALNDGIDNRRGEIFEEYLSDKYTEYKLSSIDDYDELKRRNAAKKKTMSRYTSERLMDNPRERSNGESAFKYFTEKIKENALYLLDEPENSLAPALQLELSRFLSDSVRFFGCQLVISTHSPFLLAMRGARIYDLDSEPVATRKWTELSNVRAYREFFREHEKEFDE